MKFLLILSSSILFASSKIFSEESDHKYAEIGGENITLVLKSAQLVGYGELTDKKDVNRFNAKIKEILKTQENITVILIVRDKDSLSLAQFIFSEISNNGVKKIITYINTPFDLNLNHSRHDKPLR